MSGAARKYLDAGRLISLMTVDTSGVYHMFIFIIYGMATPVLLVLTVVYVIVEIGWIGFVGPGTSYVRTMINNY
jgi:hypothetical protein